MFVFHSLGTASRYSSSIPLDIPGDAFGKIYEYFLGSFAMKEGQKGGEFFTPPSMVDLLVEIIEPFHGRLFDPASGSGGMFVSSARYVLNHKRNPSEEISIFGQELEIRKKLIQSGAVDVIVSVGPNFFYTVTLPATLWFFNKGKPEALKDKVLFLDARHIFRQIDRAHREFTPEQVEFLANIVRLRRGKEPEFMRGSEAMLKEKFPKLKYADVPGLCKAATRKESQNG